MGLLFSLFKAPAGLFTSANFIWSGIVREAELLENLNQTDKTGRPYTQLDSRKQVTVF